MRRPLPTEAEAREILARKRTRPKRRAPPPMGRSLAPFIKHVDRPLPADQEEALSRTVEAAPSPELRDALLRLGRAALKDGG